MRQSVCACSLYIRFILEAVQALQEAMEEHENSRQNHVSPGLKLKHFHGLPHEDITDWIHRFDNLAEFNGWQDIKKARALPFYLDGLASTYFSHLPQEIKVLFSNDPNFSLTNN